MQANWSLLINVLLLVGVIVAIGRLMKARRQTFRYEPSQPALGDRGQALQDDIIAVRRVDLALEEILEDAPCLTPKKESKAAAKQPAVAISATPVVEEPKPTPAKAAKAQPVRGTLMIFLMAKENRQFAGYELLQTVLSAGLRFGQGQLFHRHQQPNGQGPVICSLAAATATGTFDLQNMGACSLRGLCLFMELSNNPSVDAERFSIMLDTARQLGEGLDALLLDDKQRPLSEDKLELYYQRLQIPEVI